ncbi:replication-relaxation family protein [Parafrankia discariae]|uniref:replication-relaxation family protein n=1 Tax=Parafrankia discariae TaxID=365528 RepID=UPI0018A8332A|nr:replication-relaxation family protein [Parafrankia discariae]
MSVQRFDGAASPPAPGGPPTRPAPPLSETDTAVLMSLYQHRLMTIAQIHDLHTPASSSRWTRKVVDRLTVRGLIDHVRQAGRSNRRVWFVTNLGAQVVEDAGQILPRPGYRPSPETAAGPLQAHTLGCNEIGLSFARAARALGDDCGPGAWHHEWATRIADHTPGAARWSNMIASDLLLRYLHRGPHGDQAAVRLIEYDRNHRTLDDVLAQLRAYARYHAYIPGGARQPLWQRDHGPVFPRVLLVLDRGSPATLTTRRRSLTWMCQEDPLLTRHAAALGLLATTLEDLVAHGPWQPIFWPLTGDQVDTPVTWTGTAEAPVSGSSQPGGRA